MIFITKSTWIATHQHLAGSTSMSALPALDITQTCPENMGGWNCSYSAMNLTNTNGVSLSKVLSPKTVVFPNFDYYYFSFPNGTQMAANLTFVLTVGGSSTDVDIYWNQGGYVSDYPYAYDGSVLHYKLELLKLLSLLG